MIEELESQQETKRLEEEERKREKEARARAKREEEEAAAAAAAEAKAQMEDMQNDGDQRMGERDNQNEEGNNVAKEGGASEVSDENAEEATETMAEGGQGAGTGIPVEGGQGDGANVSAEGEQGELEGDGDNVRQDSTESAKEETAGKEVDKGEIEGSLV